MSAFCDRARGRPRSPARGVGRSEGEGYGTRVPSGSEWFIVVSLAVYALAVYGLICVIRALKRRRGTHSDKIDRTSRSAPVAAPATDSRASG